MKRKISIKQKKMWRERERSKWGGEKPRKGKKSKKKENHAEARNINIWSKINRAFLPLRNLCLRRIHKTSKKPFFSAKSLPNWAFWKKNSLAYKNVEVTPGKKSYTHASQRQIYQQSFALSHSPTLLSFIPPSFSQIFYIYTRIFSWRKKEKKNITLLLPSHPFYSKHTAFPFSSEAHIKFRKKRKWMSERDFFFIQKAMK